MMRAFLNAFVLKVLVEVTYKLTKAGYKHFRAKKKSVTDEVTD